MLAAFSVGALILHAKQPIFDVGLFLRQPVFILSMLSNLREPTP